jgi:DNA-binding NtrC family response regulator
VVDDDALVLDSLEAILTDWGFATLTAGGVQEAVALPSDQGRRPDLVISDYRLKEGRTAVGAILAIRPLLDLPIAGSILTGETDLGILRKATEQQRFGIAHKPVTPSQLCEVIELEIGTPCQERKRVGMPAGGLPTADSM